MASHGGLAPAREAIGIWRDRFAGHQGRGALMITLGLWIIATGIVALSFECLGAALVLFGIAGFLIGHA
jgi:hypothetical protein